MQKNRYFGKLIVATGLILIALASLNAQSSTGSIRGTATLPNGSPAPGADVAYWKTDNSKPQLEVSKRTVVKADFTGRFEIADLSIGAYGLVIMSYGEHQTVYENKNIQVVANGATVVEAKLNYANKCSKEPYDERRTLAAEDKADIVNQILADILAAPGLPDVDRNRPIPFSTESIDPRTIRPIAGLEFEFLEPSEIQKRADGKGFVLHLRFSDWKVGIDCVVVSLDNRITVGSRSDQPPLLGGGVAFLFRKESGKWKGRVFQSWIV